MRDKEKIKYEMVKRDSFKKMDREILEAIVGTMSSEYMGVVPFSRQCEKPDILQLPYFHKMVQVFANLMGSLMRETVLNEVLDIIEEQERF